MQQNPELVDQPLQGGRTKNIICEHKSVGQNELVSFFVCLFVFFYNKALPGCRKNLRKKRGLHGGALVCWRAALAMIESILFGIIFGLQMWRILILKPTEYKVKRTLQQRGGGGGRHLLQTKRKEWFTGRRKGSSNTWTSCDGVQLKRGWARCKARLYMYDAVSARFWLEDNQSRSQSLRSPCPAERETRDSGIKRFRWHSHWLNIWACVTDFGSDGAGKEQQNGGKDSCEGFA